MQRLAAHLSILLISFIFLCVSGNETIGDFPRFRVHPHLHSHSEHHLRQIRNMLCGLFGFGIIALGAFFLYNYLKTRSKGNNFDETAGAFAERGALLPTHQDSGPPQTLFQSIQGIWPFNARFFNQQPGGIIHTVTVDPPIPTDFYNPEDIRKSNYNPWERI